MGYQTIHGNQSGGPVTSTGYQAFLQCAIDWTTTKVGNQSAVTAKIYCRKVGASFAEGTWGTFSWSLTIGSTTVNSTTYIGEEVKCTDSWSYLGEISTPVYFSPGSDNYAHCTISGSAQGPSGTNLRGTNSQASEYVQLDYFQPASKPSSPSILGIYTSRDGGSRLSTFPKNGGVYLRWNPVSGATKYSCYAKVSDGRKSEEYPADLPSMLWSTSYLPANLSGGTQITFYVRSCNAAGNSSYSSYSINLEGSSTPEPSDELSIKNFYCYGKVRKNSTGYIQVVFSTVPGATVFYGLSSSSNKPYSWNTITSGDTINVDYNHRYVHLKATKNGESVYSYYLVEVESETGGGGGGGGGTVTPSKPVISEIIASGNIVMSLNNKKLITKLNLNCRCSYAKEYQWYIQGKGNAYVSVGSTRTVSDIDVTKICDEGQEIIVKLKIKNNVGEDIKENETTGLYRMKTLPTFSINSCKSADVPLYGKVANGFFNKKLSLNITQPVIDPNYGAPLKEFLLLDDTGKELRSFAPHKEATFNENIEVKIDYNSTTTFSLKAVDKAGQEKVVRDTQTFTRLPAYSAKTSTIKGEQKTLRWEINTTNLTDNNQDFIFSSFLPSDYNKAIYGNLNYRLFIKLNGRDYIEMLSFDQEGHDKKPPEKGTVTIVKDKEYETNNLLIYTFKGDNYYLFKLLGENAKWNQDYPQVYYKIRVENAFGECAEEKELSGEIITTSAPFFSTNNFLSIARGYSTNRDMTEKTLFNPINSKSSEDQRTINPQEIMSLQLDKLAIDKNDHEDFLEGKTTIQNYTVFYRELGKEKWRNLMPLPATPTGYNNEKPYWNFITPNISFDENSDHKIQLAIKAVDNTKKSSNLLISDENIFLIYGDRKPPIIDIQKAKLTQPKLTEDKKTVIVPAKLQMNLFPSDLGGIKGTASNFLRKENLEGGFGQKAHLKIQYSNKPDMLGEVYECTTIQDKLLEVIDSERRDEKSTSILFEMDKNFIPADSFYIRLVLSIDTNNYYDTSFNKNNSDMPIHPYYQESPVFSCRPHWVGINTKDWSPVTNEILQIKPATGKNQITIYCDRGKPIIFNLENNEATFKDVLLETLTEANLVSSLDIKAVEKEDAEGNVIGGTIEGTSITGTNINSTNGNIGILQSNEIKGALIDGGSWD